jgi:hypothetical protein
MGGNFDVMQSRTLALEYSGYVGRNVTCLCLCSRDIVVAGSADGLIVMPFILSFSPQCETH